MRTAVQAYMLQLALACYTIRMDTTCQPKTVIVTRVPERTPVYVNVDGSYSAVPGTVRDMAIRTVCRTCGKRL